MTTSDAPKISAGQRFRSRRLKGLDGKAVHIPDDTALVHLQLRRFAGCPICNLHLRAFSAQIGDIADAGVTEAVVFHSSEEDLRAYQPELPFAVIADPTRKLYQEFGVEAAPRSLLNLAVWPVFLRTSIGAIWRALWGGSPLPPLTTNGGKFGLPADFLIAPDARVVAAKYGRHASDQWTVDEVLQMARAYQSPHTR